MTIGQFGVDIGQFGVDIGRFGVDTGEFGVHVKNSCMDTLSHTLVWTSESFGVVGELWCGHAIPNTMSQLVPTQFPSKTYCVCYTVDMRD